MKMDLMGQANNVENQRDLKRIPTQDVESITRKLATLFQSSESSIEMFK